MSQDTRDHVDANTSPPALEHALVELVRRIIRKIGLELRVAAPASVVAYNPVTATATVQLELLPVEFIEGEEVPQPPIVIPNVPVRWPGGTLGHVRTGLVPTDTGHVHFSDRCLSRWLLQGGPVDPTMGRVHDLADAWFEPGLRNATNQMDPPLNPTATEVEGNPIMLGGQAVQAVALAPALHTYLVAMITASATAIGDGGEAFRAAMLAYLAANPFASYAATKVLAQ